jgi:hypothetical protein
MRHKTRPILPLLTLSATAALLAACGGSSPDPDAQIAAVGEYCTGCHNDSDYTADVSFDGMTANSIADHAELYEKVVRKLRGRVMPPPGEPQPSGETVAGLVAWLENTLDSTAGTEHISDEIVLHRLNRKEYENAIRDLLAVEIEAETLLPDDDLADGFDNIADALQVSPSFIEQYVIAARAVAIEAIGKPDARAGGWSFRAGPGSQRSHVQGMPLGTRGGILVEHNFPSDGEYVIDIADMATHIWGNGMEYENPLVVTVDSEIVYEATIGGEEDARQYDQIQDGALDRVNARLKNIRFATTAGPHKVGVTFRRRTFAESDDRLQEFVAGGGQDRMYTVNSFQILGPFNPTGLSQTPSREAIFVCHPNDGADPTLCAEDIVTTRAPIAGRSTNRISANCSSITAKASKPAVSRKAFARPSPVFSPVLTSCTAPNACRRISRRAKSMRSPTSSLPRSCRSSCGTRSRTRRCSRSQSTTA